MQTLDPIRDWREKDEQMEHRFRHPNVRREPVRIGQVLRAKLAACMGHEPDEPNLDEYADHLAQGLRCGALPVSGAPFAPEDAAKIEHIRWEQLAYGDGTVRGLRKIQMDLMAGKFDLRPETSDQEAA